MRFPPHILDEIRARLPVSAVVGRKVALKKKGREYAGLSPFKAEKTASFFVNDQKGFYHCFASGEHGDVFTFLMKTEGLSFPEAVERLAGEAGVDLPKPTEREREATETRLRLHEVLQAASDLFQSALKSPAGAEARAYIQRRGLTAETVAKFGIGFASDDRQALSQALRQRGFTDQELIQSGLRIAGPDISTPYDRFRNRIMFPIRDLKGRVVAFGGRAMDPNQPAKYLNSPETPVFHKGRMLFNADHARQAAFDTGRIVVVEGYMDVIALDQAGHGNAVAPLGTALTGDQLNLLWRFADEPTLCFDGDGAGRKAAHRAIDVAIPMLRPGASLRFAFLPDGLDPDDLIQTHGAGAVDRVLGAAKPLIDVLWDREFSQGAWQTPEQRALLEKRLHGIAASIEDSSVRSHYERDIRNRLFQAWRAKPAATSRRYPVSTRRPQLRDGRTDRGNPQRAIPPQSMLTQSRLVLQDSTTGADPGHALLTHLICNDWLIDAHADELDTLELRPDEHQRVLDLLLSASISDETLDKSDLAHQLANMGWSGPLGSPTLQHDEHTGDDHAERVRAEIELSSLIARVKVQVLQSDLAEALADFEASGSEADGARIIELKRLISSLEISEASPVDTFTPQR
jgi:DNA primase